METKELIKAHKLTEEDYQNIKEILQREPNLLEIGIFLSLWSEQWR